MIAATCEVECRREKAARSSAESLSTGLSIRYVQKTDVPPILWAEPSRPARARSISLFVTSAPFPKPDPGRVRPLAKPLPDDLDILGPALPGPVFAQVDIPTSERNDRSAHRFVELIARYSEGTDRHDKTPEMR